MKVSARIIIGLSIWLAASAEAQDSEGRVFGNLQEFMETDLGLYLPPIEGIEINGASDIVTHPDQNFKISPIPQGVGSKYPIRYFDVSPSGRRLMLGIDPAFSIDPVGYEQASLRPASTLFWISISAQNKLSLSKVIPYGGKHLEFLGAQWISETWVRTHYSERISDDDRVHESILIEMSSSVNAKQRQIPLLAFYLKQFPDDSATDVQIYPLSRFYYAVLSEDTKKRGVYDIYFLDPESTRPAYLKTGELKFSDVGVNRRVKPDWWLPVESKQLIRAGRLRNEIKTDTVQLKVAKGSSEDLISVQLSLESIKVGGPSELNPTELVWPIKDKPQLRTLPHTLRKCRESIIGLATDSRNRALLVRWPLKI